MDKKLLETLDPSILVIFGITGDLANRKLLPALYGLAQYDLLPHPLHIVGVTRQQVKVSDLMLKMRTSMEAAGQKCDQEVLDKLGGIIELVSMDLLDSDDYSRLRLRLKAIEDEAKMCLSLLYYLAVPPQLFGQVVDQLSAGGLNKACQHGKPSRLLIEKPFGYDLASAQELVGDIKTHFTEDQIYRIDHYLAKETAQNILTFRFHNPIFKDIWNNKSISHIMITASESIGIEGRVAFYEQTGALRDLVQSHLLQLLALATMDEPSDLSAPAIHRQKLALLQSVVPIRPDRVTDQAVRGQYDTYRTEVADQKSITETYAAVRLEIDSERWRGVPILLRSGKALAEKVIDITIIFSSPHSKQQNALTIRIQPDEGISLQLLAKRPGFTNETELVQMDFCYGTSFSGIAAGHPDPYERVLMDAFRGDKTLFATSEEVLACWEIVENVVHEWAKDGNDLAIYKSGTWGPSSADKLAQAADAVWMTQQLKICTVHTSSATVY